MAITFIIDISHHQNMSLDLAQTRRDGCEAAFLKATEGGSYVDPAFAPNLAEARSAGQLVAAYCYQRADSSAAAHVALITRVVPRDVPIIIDVEANGGGITLTRAIIAGLQAAGYSVPLLYIPRWYWQQIGSPSLADLPPLWSSRYPDNVVGTLASEWASVPASYWAGYGGLDVAVLQFTSSARIAGYAPLDASAYRGTREQLAALLGGSQGGGSAGPSTPTTEDEDEDEMSYFPREFPVSMNTANQTLPWDGREAVLNVIGTATTVFVGKPLNWGPRGGTGGGDSLVPGVNPSRVEVNQPGAYRIPAGTTRIFYSWSCATPHFVIVKAV